MPWTDGVDRSLKGISIQKAADTEGPPSLRGSGISLRAVTHCLWPLPAALWSAPVCWAGPVPRARRDVSICGLRREATGTRRGSSPRRTLPRSSGPQAGLCLWSVFSIPLALFSRATPRLNKFFPDVLCGSEPPASAPVRGCLLQPHCAPRTRRPYDSGEGRSLIGVDLMPVLGEVHVASHLLFSWLRPQLAVVAGPVPGGYHCDLPRPHSAGHLSSDGGAGQGSELAD